VSGDAVVQDLIYEAPEKNAQFINGDEAFNEYLKMKTVNLQSVKKLGIESMKSINLKLSISKTGTINKLELLSEPDSLSESVVNEAFKEFHGFKPALIEDVPVSSILNLFLILTKGGLQIQFDKMIPYKGNGDIHDAYTKVDEMPDFPGGETALRQFLFTNIRYPAKALEKNIQGNVYVDFIIETDGSISEIWVPNSIHPLLDAEAIRVVHLMPNWIPGKQNGKPVRVKYCVPIRFIMQMDSNEGN
jgi:protein TonB